MEEVTLAIDLGASGGRVMAGIFDHDALRLEEVHRFPNGAVRLAGRLQWDVLHLWNEIQAGLRAGRDKYGSNIRSVGVDAWGVDFALLGRGDELLGNPFSYRDSSTEGMIERAQQIVSREAIFAQTGVQFMRFNTLYQLLAMQSARSPLLDAATSFLMIPDLFHWMLCGAKVNERSNATTTQFYNPARGTWAVELLDAFDLPTKILGELVDAGTRVGKLRSEVAGETGLSGVEVILPGTHDTASAVVAVPADAARTGPPDWCYISSGTWSLMGVEIDRPILTERCRELNFTNEGGVGGTTRLLKNIGGLWLVQECRRVWAHAGQSFAWEDLSRLAMAEKPLASLVDPDDLTLQAPSNMPEAIRQLCRSTGQAVPETPGAVIRTAIESLSLKYRYVLGALEELIGNRLERIHVVGGGANNRYLCQATADACNRKVLAGPTEATALGNVVVQATSLGRVKNIAAGRDLIRTSFPLETYQPQNGGEWDRAYDRFVKDCLRR